MKSVLRHKRRRVEKKIQDCIHAQPFLDSFRSHYEIKRMTKKLKVYVLRLMGICAKCPYGDEVRMSCESHQLNADRREP